MKVTSHCFNIEQDLMIELCAPKLSVAPNSELRRVFVNHSYTRPPAAAGVDP
jgi:hypothetical protein